MPHLRSRSSGPRSSIIGPISVPALKGPRRSNSDLLKLDKPTYGKTKQKDDTNRRSSPYVDVHEYPLPASRSLPFWARWMPMCKFKIALRTYLQSEQCVHMHDGKCTDYHSAQRIVSGGSAAALAKGISSLEVEKVGSASPASAIAQRPGENVTQTSVSLAAQGEVHLPMSSL